MNDEQAATLVDPTRYAYHLNQVVGMNCREVLFLKRKFVSRSGHELVRYPVGEVLRLRHLEDRPWLTLISGALLVALVGLVGYLLVISWDDLAPQTRVPAGALGLAGVYGVRWLFGARRHRLLFTLQGGRTISWSSRAGELELRRASVRRVLELARSCGIETTPPPS